MRHILVLIFLALLIAPIAPSVRADEIVYKKSAYCLDVTWCAGGSCGGRDVHRVRLSSPADVSRRPPANASKLYLTECLHIYPTKEMYENKTPQIVCTTGNPALDAELFCGPIQSSSDLQNKMKSENCNQLLKLGDDDLTWYDFADRPGTAEYGKLQQVGIHYTIDYKYAGVPGDGNDPYRSQEASPPGSYGMFFGTARQSPTVALSSNASGELVPREVLWQSYTLWTSAREFLLWNVEEQIIRSATPVTASSAIGGQQQDSLVFPEVNVTQDVRSQACTPVAYDPYGRVFDAVSLEPIPQARVELWQKDLNINPPNPEDAFSMAYALAQNRGVPNPFGTSPAGVFSFYVGDGTYKLVASKDGYSSMTQSQASSLSPTAQQIYSNIYYTDSPAIVQAGAIQQRDIPLMPEKGVGRQYNIDLIWEKQDTEGSNLIYRGQISHPFAGIEISKCATDGISETCSAYKTFWAAEGGPNRLGEFYIKLDQTQLAIGETFKATGYERRTLTQSPLSQAFHRFVSWFGGKDVEAQEQQFSRTLDPIPSYLEGFVYDAEGNIVPDGLVELFTDYSPTAVFAARADATGRFVITSENIPKTRFKIVFAGDTKPLEMTTGEFFQTQKEYYLAEEINPYEEVTELTNPRRTVTPLFQPEPFVSPMAQAVPTTPISTAEGSDSVPTERNPMLLIGAVLLLLVGGAGVLLAVYVYKKRSSEGL